MLTTENQTRKTRVMRMTTSRRVPSPRILKKNFFTLVDSRRSLGSRRAWGRVGGRDGGREGGREGGLVLYTGFVKHVFFRDRHKLLK